MGNVCAGGKKKKKSIEVAPKSDKETHQNPVEQPFQPPPPQQNPLIEESGQKMEMSKEPENIEDLDFVPLESIIRIFPNDPLQNYSLKRQIVEECSRGDSTTLGKYSIVNDGKLVRSIAEIVRCDSFLTKFLKELIVKSRESFDDVNQIRAANAITILTAGNTPFFEEDFQDIKIKGANLIDGIFTKCDFSRADLTAVRMRNCKLQGSDFTYANLKDLDLGEYPKIECPFHITNIKLSAIKYGEYMIMTVHKNDAKIILWSSISHEKIEEFDGNTGCFSPDSETFAIAKMNIIQLWKEVTQHNMKLLKTLGESKGHSEMVNLLEFTNDSSEILSASVDKTIRLWDISSGMNIRVFHGHTDYINAISYNPVFSLIASASCDKSIIIWNKDTGKQIKKITDSQDVVNSVSFYHSGQSLISTSDESPSIIRVYSRLGIMETHLEGFHLSGIKLLTLSKNDSLFVSVCKDKILVGDIVQRVSLNEYPIKGNDQIFAAVFSSDETKLICGGTDRTVSFYDFTPARTRKIYEGPSLTTLITALAISPDGASIATGGNDHTIKLWSKSNGKLLRSYHGHIGEVAGLDFCENGSRLISAGKDKKCILWNRINGQAIEEFKLDNDASSLAVSNKENIFVCACDKILKIFSFNPKKFVANCEGHTALVTSVAFSPTGTRIVSGGLDKTVILWDTTGLIIKTFEGHSGPVHSVAFSSDFGGRIISAGGENNIKIWNSESGELVKEIEAHYYDINSIVYSAHDNLIISGSNDNKVKIFDESEGKCLGVLEGHTNHVTHVCVSQDGNFICSVGKDSVIRIWQKSMKNNDFCLNLEITSDETTMKCSEMIIKDVSGLSEFNKKLLIERGAKEYLV